MRWWTEFRKNKRVKNAKEIRENYVIQKYVKGEWKGT